MATSAKQQELFADICNRKQFPDGAPSIEQMKADFQTLSPKEGSQWIEKALTLPDQGDSGKPIPF